jgi:hypothetical protein
MFPRFLCGAFAVAMAGPCLAQDPPNAADLVPQPAITPYSTVTSTAPYKRPVVVGLARGSGYRNRYGSGNYLTCCGPGTQYMAQDCPLHLDLSNGIGLWDPANCWGPHPSCW